MTELVKAMQDALNSEEIQKKYGDVFATMNDKEKIDFQVTLIYKFAEVNPEAMRILGRFIYDGLREKGDNEK